MQDVVSLVEIAVCEKTLEVDEAEGVIKGVKILGMSSKHKRKYPLQTMRAAVQMYEGVKVNVNHSVGQRQYQDRLGNLVNVKVGRDGLYADLRFNPKHPVVEQLLWDAKNAPNNVGFSHIAEGKVRRSKGDLIVEEIVKVLSVDLVADPATSKGLFESVDLEGDDTVSLSKEDLIEQYSGEIDDIVQERLGPMVKTLEEKAEVKLEEAEEKWGKEVEDLKKQVSLQDETKKIAVGFKEKGLEKLAEDENLLVTLAGLDEEKRQQLIESMGSVGQAPKSREQGGGQKEEVKEGSLLKAWVA